MGSGSLPVGLPLLFNIPLYLQDERLDGLALQPTPAAQGCAFSPIHALRCGRGLLKWNKAISHCFPPFFVGPIDHNQGDIKKVFANRMLPESENNI